MVLSYVLVAVLAIVGYEALRAVYRGGGADAAERLARAAIVVASFVVAIPLGALLGLVTISALSERLTTGLLVLTGAVTVVAVMGLGIYTVAEGEMPAALRRPLAR